MGVVEYGVVVDCDWWRDVGGCGYDVFCMVKGYVI